MLANKSTNESAQRILDQILMESNFQDAMPFEGIQAQDFISQEQSVDALSSICRNDREFHQLDLSNVKEVLKFVIRKLNEPCVSKVLLHVNSETEIAAESSPIITTKNTQSHNNLILKIFERLTSYNTIPNEQISVIPEIDHAKAISLMLEVFSFANLGKISKFNLFQNNSKLVDFLEKWKGCDLNNIKDSSCAKFFLDNLYEQACAVLDQKKYDLEHKNIYNFFAKIVPRELAKFGILPDLAMFPFEVDDRIYLAPVLRSYSKTIQERGNQNISTTYGDVEANIYYVSELESATAVARYGCIFIDPVALSHVSQCKLTATKISEIQTSPNLISFIPNLSEHDQNTQRKMAASYAMLKIKVDNLNPLDFEKAIVLHEAEHLLQNINLDGGSAFENMPTQVIQREFDARVNQLKVDGKHFFQETLFSAFNFKYSSDNRDFNYDIQGNIPCSLILDLVIKSIMEEPHRFGIELNGLLDIDPDVQIISQLHKTANLNKLWYQTLKQYIGKMDKILTRLGFSKVPWEDP